MIAKVTRGRGFAGLVRYLETGKDGASPDRVDWVEARNLPSDDPQTAGILMRATAHQSDRVEKPVYHVSISFDHGDPVDRAHYYDFDSAYLLDLPERVTHFTIDSEVVPPTPSPASRDTIGASCTLEADERAERLAAWRAVRARALSIEQSEGGLRLVFAPTEPLEQLATLVAQESDCCAFYRFTLRVDGPARVLEINAGTGNAAAARALLGLD